ncbi:MAG: SH3 domain-containing protein [Chloroflexi bacterium]|nr:SH3 domain-containing protein [Chloroflexota bacterium]
MNRSFSKGKQWFLVITLFTTLLLTSQVFAKNSRAQTATAVIATGALNVRSGPGIEYSVVTVVNQGHVVNLLGRNADSSWAYVQTATAAKGWVNASSSYITPSVAISSLDVVTTATATPTATPTSTPTPTPATTATALVATGALNVRSGPGVTYSVLTVATQGQTVTLLGRNANSSWAKIRLSNGTEGWVNASLLTSNVSISSLPLADSPAAPELPIPVAPGAVLSLRSGPGSSYQVTGSVYQGLQVTAVGRNASSTWLKVQLSDGQQGWIGAQFVQLSIPVANLPVMDGSSSDSTTTSSSSTPPTTANWATVSTGAANMRSGPGVGYGIVSIVGQGQYVTLLARNSISSWAKVQLSDNTVGWINASLLNANVAINSLPVENVQTLSASGLVNTAALNVRTGPGIGYGVTAVVYQDQGVALLGRNADSSWLKVRLNSGEVGWVNGAYIDTVTTLNSLPITD